jgi:hypothetical protein
LAGKHLLLQIANPIPNELLDRTEWVLGHLGLHCIGKWQPSDRTDVN